MMCFRNVYLAFLVSYALGTVFYQVPLSEDWYLWDIMHIAYYLHNYCWLQNEQTAGEKAKTKKNDDLSSQWENLL